MIQRFYASVTVSLRDGDTTTFKNLFEWYKFLEVRRRNIDLNPYIFYFNLIFCADLRLFIASNFLAEGLDVFLW